MNVLILGFGGREHAIAAKIAQSTLLNKLFIAPGNAGTALLGQNISISITDFEAIKKEVLKYQINLVIVGPELPLVAGIHDYFVSDIELQDVRLIAPKKQGAQLEGSKAFAKEFMLRHKIPTAAYQSFTKKTLKEGFIFLEKLKPPYVIKVDGLAAGKGVLILNDLDKAKHELQEIVSNNKFGNAGQTVVIEEFLKGIEMSCFALTDGKDYIILPNAKDYKRIGEGDTGLNTGGMGAVSPVPFADTVLSEKIEQKIIRPTILGLQKEAVDYQGFLFFGLMIVDEEPFVIEYNVRMGDPETEVVFPRIDSDVLALFQASVSGNLKNYQLKVNPKSAATVMAVSKGYPEAYEKGKEITGLDLVTDSIVFHSGTKSDGATILSNGGRVLAITSFGNDFKEALKKSYKSLGKIHFQGITYRNDIGFDL